jgi:hypothetical protein
MFRNSGTAGSEIAGNLADRTRTFSEQVQDLSPRRMGDGPEDCLTPHFFNCNHIVT